MGWEQAQTFEEYVFSLFEEKKTDSPEFKALVSIFGREKLKELWNKYCALHKGSVQES